MNGYMDGKYFKTAFTAQELAADDAFWQEQLDRAKSCEDMDRLHRMREYLRNNGPIGGLIAAAAGRSRWGKIPENAP